MTDQNRQMQSLNSWIDECQYDAFSVSIGHGKAVGDKAFSQAFAEHWVQNCNWVRENGGFVINIADWPECAASWLQPAKRLLKDGPDLIVLIGHLKGLTAVLRRIALIEAEKVNTIYCVLTEANDIFNDAREINAFDGLKLICIDGDRWVVHNREIASVGHFLHA